MASDVQDTFRKALQLHQQGEMRRAQALYEEVLRREPRHFDSLHLLGLTHVQLGAVERGVAYISAAVELRSDFPEARYNLGNALLSLGKPDAALAELDKAIALSPKDALYHFERGNALKELQRSAEALQAYEAAVRLAPRFAEAYNNMGILLKDERKFEAALAQYDRAISLRPQYAEAHSNRGNALKELERFEEALQSYDRAIHLKPDYAEAYSNCGNALARIGRLAEALASHDKAISLKPDYAEAHNNRGNVLKELGRYEEAVASFDRAISLKPDYAEAFSNRGSALEEQGRLDEALASHDRAINLKPGAADAWRSRGDTLTDLERVDEALESYARAISLDPALAIARYNKSLLDLRRRSFAEGFELYLSRWAAEKPGARGPATAIPRWDGEACNGQILLWAEQGLGDEVFCASFLSLLDPALKVTLSADKRLHPCLSRAFPSIRLISRELTATSLPDGFAAQAPVGDLGHILQVDAGKIARRRYPYLAAEPERREQVRASNRFRKGEFVCGVSWRSGNAKLGPHRSVALADLSAVLDTEGVSFVNLQYGDVEQEIAGVGARLGRTVHVARDVDVFSDIEGLLALIDLCDVVFTIDNVTAHLAGALGKPAVVLVPAGRGRHWYWGGESQSLWYPSLRLVYQGPGEGWASAIAQGAAIIGALSAAATREQSDGN